MNRVKVCMFFPAWRFIWEQEKEKKKNLCKLSGRTTLFPQPVRRSKYYVSGHSTGLKVDFSNMGLMLANLYNRLNLLRWPSPNTVLSNTSLLTSPTVFILLFCSSVFPKLRLLTLKWLIKEVPESSRTVFSSFFNLSSINPLPPSKHTLPSFHSLCTFPLPHQCDDSFCP